MIEEQKAVTKLIAKLIYDLFANFALRNMQIFLMLEDCIYTGLTVLPWFSSSHCERTSASNKSQPDCQSSGLY